MCVPLFFFCSWKVAFYGCVFVYSGEALEKITGENRGRRWKFRSKVFATTDELICNIKVRNVSLYAVLIKSELVIQVFQI